MLKFDRQTVMFSLNSFAAAMLALFIAFALDFQRPYWAMMTVYIVSNPFSGAVRSKAVYRLLGSLIGAGAMMVLIPNLVDSPPVLSLAIALWVGGCLIVSLLDRTPRSYTLMLAGYTAALIGFPAVNQPDAVFDIAVARLEEIGLGIVCATVMHSLFFPRPVGDVLEARLGQWLSAADRWLLEIAQGGVAAEHARSRSELAASASDIRVQATHLPFDTSRMRETQAAVRALHERMLVLIPRLSEIEDLRDAFTRLGRRLPRAAQARLDESAAWARSGADYQQGQALTAAIRDTAAKPGADDWRQLLIKSLLVRLADVVTVLAEGHAVLSRVRAPDSPAPAFMEPALRRGVARPLHNDVALALRSGATCVIAVLAACALWIGAGWPEGAVAASLAAVFCAMFASLDDPAPMILAFSVAAAVGIVLAALYNFAIFPAIDGFPLLAAALFPPLFLFGLIMGNPSTTPKGLALAVTFGSALALHDTSTADFAAFLNANLAVFVATFVAVFINHAMRSMTAEAGVQRLRRMTWGAIGRLAGRSKLEDPAEAAAVLVDRVALLAPKLALPQPAGAQVADGALHDLRVAMNTVELRLAQGTLPRGDRDRVQGVVDGIAAFFSDRVRDATASAPRRLLERVDEALGALTGRPGAPEVNAVLNLVGLRHNLFPAAAPFVAAKEQTA
jgi:uncharacterized membrane protein YccC